MGEDLFNTEELLESLRVNAAIPDSAHDFGSDISERLGPFPLSEPRASASGLRKPVTPISASKY